MKPKTKSKSARQRIPDQTLLGVLCLCASILLVHGATDEVSSRAEENSHYSSDLHATIFYQLDLNHKKMEVETMGRTMRFVEEGGPIKEIIS